MPNLKRITALCTAALLLTLSACQEEQQDKASQQVDAQSAKGSDEVVVYSSRKEHLIKPFFEQFTAETGIPVKYITDKAGPLISRLQAEGERTPADLFMTVDAGNLWFAKQQQVLQPLDSEKLNNNVASHLRDPDNYWYGLTVRARTIVYDSAKVQPEQLSSYEELADPKWKGKLCLRTSKKVYNQSLIAMMIARHGEQKAQQIVEGWVANLATAPFSNDTKVMKAIEAGQCELGIVNTYYFGRLQKENPKIGLKLFWPNQDDNAGGVHVNISGAGITKHAGNVTGARRLMEWLSSIEAQKLYAGENLEYPVNNQVKPVPQVSIWGEFNADPLNLSQAGKLQPAAIQLMDRAGYK